MKKLIIVSVLLLALSIVGILYGTQDQSEKEEMVTIEQMYMDQSPNQMPDVVLDPMVGFPVY